MSNAMQLVFTPVVLHYDHSLPAALIAWHSFHLAMQHMQSCMHPAKYPGHPMIHRLCIKGQIIRTSYALILSLYFQHNVHVSC
jgi:hypothetical protein